jgi:ATP-dependent RNA helicase DeaD
MNEPAAPPSETPAAQPTFDVLPLGAEVRRAVDAMGYVHPTPVQRAVFEPAAEGRSLVVQARTGTGKTAAFGLPIVDRLVRPQIKAVQALVLCPTRELALQVSREVEQIGRFRGTQVVAIYGGASMSRQIEALEAGAQIVIGTPGRVLDHLRQRTLDPSGIRILVLDEADEMLSMGFARELNAIIETLPKHRQGLFFSATIPADIERLAHTHLRDTELITLSSDQVGALEIEHYVYVTQAGDKLGQLVRILEVEDPESAIVFCNTRDETQRVAEGLKTRGFDADWLNGDLPQSDRERVMGATREGKLRFLVATDVAARGIDISHLTHVINYDFPDTAEQYVHRTGRTGRAGRTGTAIALVGPKDIGNLYLLRLTYKIRPIEKQLPSAGEMKTRAEMDLLSLFVDAFAARSAHQDDLSLARRLLTHHDAERIVAGLLRDHLGARGGDAPTAAAEARRARNPEPQPQAPPPRPAGAAAGEPARGGEEKSEAGREERPRREPRGPKGTAANTDVGRSPQGTAANTDVGRSPQGTAANTDDMRRRAAEPRRRDREGEPRRTGGVGGGGGRSAGAARPAGAPVSSYTNWEPPHEEDDERPILAEEEDTTSPLPRYTVEGEADEVRGRTESDRSESDEGFVQLFVNVGKREGVRASELQRMLTDKGMGEQEIGRIRVRDRMSFISVKREALDRAAAALSGQVVGGRTVVAELARGRGAS